MGPVSIGPERFVVPPQATAKISSVKVITNLDIKVSM
jgi:hypothetical protein